MIVAGVMSGTSADGIDVAIMRISGRPAAPKLRLLAHYHQSYPRAVREAILGMMNAPAAAVADIARMNVLLGELYSDAVRNALRRPGRIRLDLVGCHGQTIYHQGARAKFLGKNIATTWQTGEAAVIAQRLGVPVVSDFRPADMAAGGKGAPLVPLVDYTLFRHPRRGRILLNIGGIANITAIPAGARMQDVIAFDTGPGNMVIDATMQKLFGRPYDHNGEVAARGRVLKDALKEALRDPFFSRRPPKTAGREQFGFRFSDKFMYRAKKSRYLRDQSDVITTAASLTARSIADAIGQLGDEFEALIASGGGTQNRTLMRMIASALPAVKIRVLDELGIPSTAKEAMAFALLAYKTWHRLPGNVPSATGAKSAAVLGKISLPPVK